MEAIGVAGVSRRMEALQHKAFAPGATLLLKPEPDNRADPNAVGVWDSDSTMQAGYLPREVAERISKGMREGERYRCLSMWEDRRKGQRVAVRVLLLRGAAPPRPGEDIKLPDSTRDIFSSDRRS